MRKYHRIEKVAFENDRMALKVDEKEYTFPIGDISKRLAKASQAEREKYEISPSGYGIHWPLIDEDLSIDGLIGEKRKQTQTKESISA
ncbi:MAG: DUF2442 domain-containing protein [Sedimentisphaerales bacterium]|jgi:hypothetical protein